MKVWSVRLIYFVNIHNGLFDTQRIIPLVLQLLNIIETI